MTKRTRLLILLCAFILFLILTPYIILYSIGYRIDFENMKITATGGIYVRLIQPGAEVIVDNNIKGKAGLFSNAVFVQNLLPKKHSVSINKEGYFEYQKELEVKETEVTKIESVILFKKDIGFEFKGNEKDFLILKNSPKEKFIIEKGGLYYSDAIENIQLTATQKKTPVIKDIVSFTILDGNIIWLGSDGFLKKSDQQGKNTQQISQNKIKINPKSLYSLKVLAQNIFLKENNSLLLFDQESKSFKDFYSSVKDFKISPDGKKIIYFNNNEIFIYYLNNNDILPGTINKTLLQKYPDIINDLYWMNSDYIIFNAGSKIIISEIDSRGNVNSITLNSKIKLADGEEIAIENSEIFFSQEEKKLYILIAKNMFVSEKLIP